MILLADDKILDNWVMKNQTYRLESWSRMVIWFSSLSFFHFILLLNYQVFQTGAGFIYSLFALAFCMLYAMFSTYRYYAEWKRIAAKYLETN